MNVQSLRQMKDDRPVFETVDAYFCWTARQTEKYELVDGVAKVLPYVKRGHSLIVSNLIIGLATRLDGERFYIHSGDFATRTGDRSLRYADVMVEPANAAIGERMTETPILLVEILSDSTMHVDFGQKWIEYQRLESLQAYLILDQPKRCAWLFARTDDGEWPKDPVVIEEGDVPLTQLGVVLPLEAIYRGVA